MFPCLTFLKNFAISAAVQGQMEVLLLVHDTASRNSQEDHEARKERVDSRLCCQVIWQRCEL
jgi:hypothetical protein